MRLDKHFFENPDVNEVAQKLLGKTLVTNFDGQYTSGIIIETEAYCGFKDKACHAYKEKRTPRTEIFYEEGGLAYIYLCYGIHHLFNIITGPKDWPQAVLVRAVLPYEGLKIQSSRRKGSQDLASGPGKLSQALGIKVNHNGDKLYESQYIWFEDHGRKLNYTATPRIGIGYAEEDALLPWRYIVEQKFL